MKKIIGFLIIMVLSVAFSYSQNATIDKTMNYSATYLNYTGVATDIIEATGTWTYTVKKKTDTRLYPYIYMEIDSISGTPAYVYIIRQGKVTPSESYTNIDTVRYGGTVDTTFYFDDSTARKYLYNRILVKGLTGDFKVEIQKLEFLFLK